MNDHEHHADAAEAHDGNVAGADEGHGSGDGRDGEGSSPWADAKAFLAEGGELGVQDLTGVKGKARVFSTGSYGWNMNGKAKVVVNGKECMLQVSVNAIVIGSKPAEASGKVGF